MAICVPGKLLEAWKLVVFLWMDPGNPIAYNYTVLGY